MHLSASVTHGCLREQFSFGSQCCMHIISTATFSDLSSDSTLLQYVGICAVHIVSFRSGSKESNLLMI